MPKSKKNKAKHKDFQKVKLKVGRRLPKGLNETKATFQSAGINIKNQFKDDLSQVSAKRRLSITDTLSHLRHFAAGMKHDALQTLKEIVATDPSVLRFHLPSIIERLSELFVDRDGVVRSTTQKLLKIIFPKIRSDQLAPFFPIISAHICCAMTHIQDDIRYDSLPLLDLCLEHYPSLVISNTSNLLPNFLEQISQQCPSGGGNRGASRTLLVNPNSKLSSKKWRIKVLARLENFLKALTNSHYQGYRSRELDRLEELVVTANGKNSISAASFLETPVSGYTIRSANLASGDDILGDPLRFKSYFRTIVPLLNECWIEAGPAQMNAGQKAGNTLSAEALVTLRSVLGVLQLLIKYVHDRLDENAEINMSWVKSANMSSFVHHYMTYFPYSMTQRVGNNPKQKKNKDESISVVSINLAVCDVMSYFWFEDDRRVSDSKWFGWIVSFVSQQLSGESRLSQADLKCVIRILHKVVGMTSQQETIRQILDAAAVLYKRKHPSSSDAVSMLHLFQTLVVEKRNRALVRDLPSIGWWMTVLPEHAVQVSAKHEAATLAVYSAMNELAAQNHAVFLDALQRNLPNLLDFDYVRALQPTVQKKLAELMYWVPRFSGDTVARLSGLCHGSALDGESVIMLVQVLQMRIDVDRSSGEMSLQPSCYISLLLSIISGYSQAELASLSQGQTGRGFVVVADVAGRAAFMQKTSKPVRCSLEQVMERDEMWSIITPYVENVMSTFTVLPAGLVCSILLLVCDYATSDTSDVSSSPTFVTLLAGWILSFTGAIVQDTVTQTFVDPDEQGNGGAACDDSSFPSGTAFDHGDALKALVKKCVVATGGCVPRLVSLYHERLSAAGRDEIQPLVLAMTWTLKCLGPDCTFSELENLTNCVKLVEEHLGDQEHPGQWLASHMLELGDLEVHKRGRMRGEVRP